MFDQNTQALNADNYNQLITRPNSRGIKTGLCAQCSIFPILETSGLSVTASDAHLKLTAGNNACFKRPHCVVDPLAIGRVVLRSQREVQV